MSVCYPDYNNGIVNLACSVLKHYGAVYTHPTLPIADRLLGQNKRNVVALLLDGLGVKSLEYHLPQESFLRRHFITGISSVFPTTTTAAITSLESGLTPAEHGWLGWSLYFSELDKIVNTFPNTDKLTGEQAADYHVAGRYLPYKSIYGKIHEAGNAEAYSVSKFGSNKIESFDGMTDEIVRLSRRQGRKYIYAYWEDPDAAMHMKGCEDSSITEWLKEADRRLEHMANELEDTLLIIIADHGHININNKVLTDYPQLTKMMKRSISIESRTGGFYIKDKYKDDFPEEFKKIFGEDFLLLHKKDVIHMRLFGDGAIHPKFEELIGDYLAIAVSDQNIVSSPKSMRFASNHAGLTDQEMMVPLIVIGC